MLKPEAGGLKLTGFSISQSLLVSTSVRCSLKESRCSLMESDKSASSSHRISGPGEDIKQERESSVFLELLRLRAFVGDSLGDSSSGDWPSDRRFPLLGDGEHIFPFNG